MADGGERAKLLTSMQFAAGTAYLAGQETVSHLCSSSHQGIYGHKTLSALLNFVLLMLLNPEAQRKAHEELDRVIGRERLPDLEDKDSLRYINAICKEVLRIYPILPLAIPHVAIAEDVYNGIRIPRGASLFPNVW